MNWKDILVHVDDTKACAARIDLAVSVAKAHGAHLIGLYAMMPVYVPGFVAAEAGPAVRYAREESAREARERTAALFERQAGKAGLSAEWRTADGPAGDAVTLHARYADLAVVGQTDPEEELPVGSTHLPEEVVLGAGRPVLVAPYAGAIEDIGKRVMIAWNGSIEAARAVNDALPFLERADRVTVLAVNPEPGPSGLGDLPGGDLALHLTRHGITVEAAEFVDEVPTSDRVPDVAHRRPEKVIGHVSVADLSIGDALLARIADEGIDLLVMGAYGHSRLRELVMGGVTRHILREMTVPVLISH